MEVLNGKDQEKNPVISKDLVSYGDCLSLRRAHRFQHRDHKKQLQVQYFYCIKLIIWNLSYITSKVICQRLTLHSEKKILF